MKIIGAILLAIGILIAGLSGTCSLFLLADSGTWTGPSAGESLTIVALVGGIPFACGALLIFAGYRLIKVAGDRGAG